MRGLCDLEERILDGRTVSLQADLSVGIPLLRTRKMLPRSWVGGPSAMVYGSEPDDWWVKTSTIGRNTFDGYNESTPNSSTPRGLHNRYNHNRHLDFNYLIIKAFNFDYII